MNNKTKDKINTKSIMGYYEDYEDYDYYEDDDREAGCGEGWSCSNCPNYGCPANEQN